MLELAHVGELFNIILEDPFSELKAKFYFYQMANAVEYLHRQVRKQFKIQHIFKVIQTYVCTYFLIFLEHCPPRLETRKYALVRH